MHERVCGGGEGVCMSVCVEGERGMSERER